MTALSLLSAHLWSYCLAKQQQGYFLSRLTRRDGSKCHSHLAYTAGISSSITVFDVHMHNRSLDRHVCGYLGFGVPPPPPVSATFNWRRLQTCRSPIACSFARVVTTHGSDRFFIVQGYANCDDSKTLQSFSTSGVDLIQTIHQHLYSSLLDWKGWGNEPNDPVINQCLSSSGSSYSDNLGK